MENEGKTIWYLKPHGTLSNASLFEFLTNLGMAATATSTPLKDGRGKPHNLVALDSYAQVKQALACFSESSGILFVAFVKPRGRKRIGLWIPRGVLSPQKLANYKKLAAK